MKNKITSVLAILLVFFATFGIGAAIAQENETVDEEEDQEEIEEEKEESDEEIEEAEEEIAEAEEEIEEEAGEGADTTQAEEYNSEAQALLAQATDAWNAGEYKEARKLAKEAKKAAMQAKRGKAFKKMKLLHLYDVFFYQMEKHRIGMEAIIAYVDEGGEVNAGSENLVVIKDDFVALEGELETAANQDDDREFKRILKDARDLTKNFKEEAHDVLSGEGAIGEARTKVNEALKENEEYLKSLLNNIQNSREESELEIVDDINEEIGEKIEKAKEEGADTEELEAALEEMEDKREELEAALEAAIASCEDVSIDECDTTEAEDYRALKEQIKDGYKELRQISKKAAHAKRISKTIGASYKVLEKHEKRIAKAEENGVDVTVVKVKLDEVRGMLDSAKTKYDAGDYEGALEELKNAQEALKKSDIKKAVKSRKEAGEDEEDAEDKKDLNDRGSKRGR